MIKRMCLGCPFRRSGKNRSALIKHITHEPEETWPCHEDTARQCAGRELFANFIATLRGTAYCTNCNVLVDHCLCTGNVIVTDKQWENLENRLAPSPPSKAEGQ